MSLVKKVLSRMGYQLVRKQGNLEKVSRNRAENFPKYLDEATALDQDVNDYINSRVGRPDELLNIVVYPNLSKNANIFIEIGPGTGRFAREVLKWMEGNDGFKIYLVDHSKWIITFLSDYFERDDKVIPLLNEGISLSGIESGCADMVFANGVFIELNLSRFYSYCNEAYRTLKPGGHLIFNYLDLNYDLAWEHMKKNSVNPNFSFSYFTGEVIDSIFLGKGFVLKSRDIVGNSSYVVYTKP